MRKDGWLRKSWRGFNAFVDAMDVLGFLFFVVLVLVLSGITLYDCVTGPFKAEEPPTETVIPRIEPR